LKVATDLPRQNSSVSPTELSEIESGQVKASASDKTALPLGYS